MTLVHKLMPQIRLQLATVIVLVLLASTALRINAQAFDSNCQSAQFIDLDQDGSPDQMMLDCDFENDDTVTDTLIIVDRDDDLKLSDDWRAHIDDQNDLWLFDYQTDGDIELVIDFYAQDNRVTADIYETFDLTQDELNALQRALTRSSAAPPQGIYPAVRVVSNAGWKAQDAQINFNLDIYVDGPIESTFDSGGILSSFTKDGNFDFQLMIRDHNHNGRPEYDWRTLQYSPNTPANRRTLPRSYLMTNVNDNEPPLSPYLPWPYLGAETYGYLTSSPTPFSQPPIQVDWATGRIVVIGEFVRSRGNDSQWFIYSDNELVAGRLNSPNFEVPFAWYDLAQDSDRQAELAIRVLYYPPDSMPYRFGKFPFPITNIRYSWDQDNDGFWDYKLGLLQRLEINETVTIPTLGLDLKMIPYDELPDWVFDQEWSFFTFVAAENIDATGEGVYEWDPQSWTRDLYFTGLVDTPVPLDSNGQLDLSDLRFQAPANDPGPIDIGFRGEYRFAPMDGVDLYMSPIDRRLHLRWSEAGVARTNAATNIVYSDQFTDGYIDSWTVTREDKFQAELHYAAPYLIFSDDNETRIKRVDLPFMTFEAHPPRDHEEWNQFSAELDQPSVFTFDNLQAMYDQFTGDEWIIHEASIRDFRAIDDGFRQLLLVRPDYQMTTQGSTFDYFVQNLQQAGAYVVEWTDNTPSIRLATPPDLSVDIQFDDTATQTLAQFESAPIHVNIRNRGLRDATNAHIQILARLDQNVEIISETFDDILAGETTSIEAVWSPVAVGKWEIIAKVDSMDNAAASSYQIVIAASATITIQESFEDVGLNLLSLYKKLPFNGIFVATLLVTLSILASVISYYIFQSIGDS